MIDIPAAAREQGESIRGSTMLASLALFYAGVSGFAGNAVHFAAPALAAVGVVAGVWSTIASVKRGEKRNRWIATASLGGSISVLVVSLFLLTAA